MAAFLAGCAATHGPGCASTEQQWVSELLYFGTEKPDGVVSPDQWSAFLASTVTPRFPQGLTVWQGEGQWQSAAGLLTREHSFVLNLHHPESETAERSVREIIAEYKSRFQQEAILRVKSPSCVSFL